MSNIHLTNQRVLFILIVIFIVCLVGLEIVFFSHNDIESHHHQDSLSIVVSPELLRASMSDPHHRKLNLHPNTDIHSLYDPSYDATKDWFNSTAFHSDINVNFSCPVYENICVYNQHFYVHSPEDTFDLKWRKRGDLLGDNMPNFRESMPVYANFFHATVWNENEYSATKCYYNTVYNHLILEANYQTMLGEFYSRTLRFLHYLHDMKELITNDIQLWLLIGDQKSLYVSHYLFTERFSKYNLLHFTSMFDHVPCQCYHRILFCGFHKEGHEIPWPRKDRKGKKNKGVDILQANVDDTKEDEPVQNNRRKGDNLMPLATLVSRMEPSEARDIYPPMIVEYNNWVDTMDSNIDDDVRKWKYDQLIGYFKNISSHDKYTFMDEIDEWRFIGLYDRKVRRSWLKIQKHQRLCNEKYNKYKIFCHIIILENFLHSRDVIIIHRASFMLVGVHGAQLTDAIWMKYDGTNKYIIELLPYGAPKYTSSILKPTALGVIFWGSQYNHVGLKLLNTSMQYPQKRWDDNDFYVKWERLTLVIDFLILDGGGMCNRFGRSDRLEIPKNVMDLGFAVYNAYCVEDPFIWHGVKVPRLY
eukprot:261857_1